MKRAIASGILTVRHLDGRSVSYQSTEEMLKALGAMEAEVAGGSGGTRSTYASFTRD
jgi:hypothetical protein